MSYTVPSSTQVNFDIRPPNNPPYQSVASNQADFDISKKQYTDDPDSANKRNSRVQNFSIIMVI